jgi:hypothetical protein
MHINNPLEREQADHFPMYVSAAAGAAKMIADSKGGVLQLPSESPIKAQLDQVTKSAAEACKQNP